MTDKALDGISTLEKKLSQCKKAGKEKVEILNQLSKAHWSSYPHRALDYGKQALELSEKINDKEGKGRAVNTIGVSNYYLTKYDSALEYFFKALKIHEELGIKRKIASSYNNIGMIYDTTGKYENALEVYGKSMEIEKEIGNKKGLANSLNNTGNVYSYLKKHDKALEHHKKALKIFEEINDKLGISASLNNIGDVYLTVIEKPDKAIKYVLKSLKINEEIGNKNRIAISLINLGDCYTKLKNPQKALIHLNRGLKISEEIEAKNLIRDCYKVYSELYSIKENYKKAIEYYKLYSKTKDSIFTEESSKKIAEMQTKYETEKKEKEAEIFRLKNVELVKANNKLKEANKIIAEKNEHIMSSIRYAERIQNAILPLNEKMKKALPEHFIIFKPRDIVSGDFYWFNQIRDKIIFAVVDCTGHGVPGAFMSMIGNTILNELINEKHIFDPALILENLHTEVRFALKQETGEAESTDGMDVCLCVMEPKKHKLTFSGAKRPLYHVANSTLTKIKGDRKTIGGRQKEEKRTFTNHEIYIQEGDAIYLTSDGYADQADVEGQKFGSKRLEKLFLNIATQSCKKQKQKLLTELKNHSGKEEQRDDITVIGIEFNKLEEVKSYG